MSSKKTSVSFPGIVPIRCLFNYLHPSRPKFTIENGKRYISCIPTIARNLARGELVFEDAEAQEQEGHALGGILLCIRRRQLRDEVSE